jgi:adenylate cyclase
VDQKRVTRKLRAILSADVAGYSRLMGDDEVATFKTITEYREIFSSVVKQYNGRVVDSPGDNILSEFASVVDAVQCAVEIQKVLKAKNDELPEDRRMIFRIGVNLGDVIHEDDRIYGDGVNIAARIESLAEPGGICISGTAYDQIENKLALGYNFFGEHSVKNIKKPVRVYKVPMDPKDVGSREKPKLAKKVAIVVAVVTLLAVAAIVWNSYLRSSPTPTEIPTNQAKSQEKSEKLAQPASDKPSIAVLPFDNMSGDPSQEYLSDGITEQIITALSKTPRLFVIARNSSFAFKGKSVNVSQIGQELGVRYILEGSVQKSGNRLRITAQLIDVKTDAHLWAEKYDKELKDIFDLQDEITLNVLSALQVHLGDGEDARLWSRGTDNLEAYIKFLQGLRYYHQLANKESYLVKAPRMFEKAITLDPQFPAPYFFLAMIHRWSPFFDSKIDPKQAIRRAMEFLQKGMKLDSSDPLAHSALGLIYQAQGKHQKAISEAEKAVSLEPNMAEAYWLLGVNLQYEGRYEEAIVQIKKAIRLNPIPPPYYHMFLGNAYQLEQRYEDSISAYKKAIQISPNYLFPHMRLAISYGLIGREKDARAEAKEVLRINPKFSGEHFLKIVTYKDKAAKDLLSEGLQKAGLLQKNASSSASEKPSIAVLPFVNIGGDQKEDYLSDGITEQLITALSKTPKLHVIARNSVFTYKGKPVKVQEVAKDLGVRYVLEGSVQKAGNRLRITAQLIDAKTGNHLWAEKYDRELKDIFELQDDIARNVIMGLQVELTEGDVARLFGKGTRNLEAYLKVQKGIYHVYKWNKTDNEIGRQLYREAIELDRDYSNAYVLIGWTYLHEASFRWTQTPKKSRQEAIEWANKAIALDPSNAVAYRLTSAAYAYLGQIDKAQENVKKAYSLDPNNSDILYGYGHVLNMAGQFDKAILLFQKAITIDPIPPFFYFARLGWAYSQTGRSEEASAEFKLALEKRAFPVLFARLGCSFISGGRLQKALDEFDKAMSKSGKAQTWIVGNRAIALIGIGKSEEAIKIMQDLVSNKPEDPDGYLFLSDVFLLSGRNEKALQMAKKAVALRNGPNDNLECGMSHLMLTEYDQAIPLLKKSIQLWPDYLAAHVGLAAAYCMAGRMEDARSEVAEIHRINPKYKLEDVSRNGYYAYQPVEKERFLSALRKAGLE